MDLHRQTYGSFSASKSLNSLPLSLSVHLPPLLFAYLFLSVSLAPSSIESRLVDLGFKI